MAIIKCKMCGGNLELNESVTVGTCLYCGSTMTLPNKTDEMIVNLFNRANHLRRNNEFDKATGVYESILNQDAKSSEAYWGLVLCKYGIEYVEDPETHKLVPTCHRTQYGSILKESDYKAALEYADSTAKLLYEEEANVIDKIQKHILEISSKEEPFDVFICYKELNEAGTRTLESVLAQDLYFQLKGEGFKVFFSRITLEDKLGSAYEPYIFAALNSARVMVVIATQPKYVNSVWVKNEWKRYLALIEKGEKKTLIPAYRGMDPYDLPEEFLQLQAQDMSKLGFMQDLIRGVTKLLTETQHKETGSSSKMIGQSNLTVEPLLKRAYISLEDGEFKKADNLLERVLDLDPENATAYVGKLLSELRLEQESELIRSEQSLTENINFQRALRFADEDYRNVLEGYNQKIIDRLEIQRKEAVYQEALQQKRSNNRSSLQKAFTLFQSIPGYKESNVLAEECQMLDFESIYQEGLRLKRISVNSGEYQYAAKIFDNIAEYKDAKAQAEECKMLANKAFYQKGVKKKANSITESDYQSAAKIFMLVPEYKDTSAQIDECIMLANECVYQEGLRAKTSSTSESDFQTAAKIFSRIQEYKDSALQAEECENLAVTAQINLINKKKRDKKLLITFLISSAAIIAFVAVLIKVILPTIKYHRAEDLLINGEYQEAVVAFTELGDFRNSENRVKESYYLHAMELKGMGSFSESIEYFTNAGDYADANDQLKESYYITGNELLDQGKIAQATDMFMKAGDFKNATLKVRQNISFFQGIITAGSFHTVGLKADGTVLAVGGNINGDLNVSGWEDIIAISAGRYHTVGLKADGTVVAVGRDIDGQLNVSEWEDIVAVAAGNYHTVGLKSDGTVVAVGIGDSGQLNVSEWEDIIAISAGRYHTVGLKLDGTVVAVGTNNFGRLNVSEWNLFE